MKVLWICIISGILLSSAYAATRDTALLPIRIDLKDKAKLQRGAGIYMNYCSGCHSLRYIRYNRMAEGLGLTTFDGQIDTTLLENNLIFTSAQPVDPIQISMPEVDAQKWFGRLPPDLTLSARVRGAPWLYTYLKSFYVDKDKPFGTNNLLFPDVGMPNVLAPLSGVRILSPIDAHSLTDPNSKLLLIESGEMTPQQFDSALEDLVTFLVYVSEPGALNRYALGRGVIFFLCVLLIFAYLLKKVYWRRIH